MKSVYRLPRVQALGFRLQEAGTEPGATFKIENLVESLKPKA
ncbi:MAG TPA: hypothetical protein VN948_18540 [Terriglobales bacterium]|nr:hypothetical protein [Terriglobales bacterium]